MIKSISQIGTLSYTDLKSYQLIISLLKQYGITHCVLSAGSRNVPFVHSIEEDPEFHCYSVVDERRAGSASTGNAIRGKSVAGCYCISGLSI